MDHGAYQSEREKRKDVLFREFSQAQAQNLNGLENLSSEECALPLTLSGQKIHVQPGFGAAQDFFLWKRRCALAPGKHGV